MADNIGFWKRLQLAWRLLFDAAFAARAADVAEAPDAGAPKAPERVHASGLMLLAALQREGRLVDFLQQDVAGFSDEDIGAAARVVHTGSRKVLQQFFELKAAVPGDEGMPMSVPEGFDAQRIRLTGNVTGSPPFRGTLKHHGWVARDVRMPAISEALDPTVIAPAEVELS